MSVMRCLVSVAWLLAWPLAVWALLVAALLIANADRPPAHILATSWPVMAIWAIWAGGYLWSPVRREATRALFGGRHD